MNHSSKMSILVCDDEGSVARGWADLLEGIPEVSGSFVVTAIDLDQFRSSVETLEERRRQAREGTSTQNVVETPIDKADVLIVDYDLLGVEERSYLTGENIAYLARCYSDCGYIVGVNQFGDNPFDLTLLEETESFADVNVGGRQITLPALWGRKTKGFRPWSWPNLVESPRRFSRLASELAGALDESIIRHLGLSDSGLLSYEVLEFLRIPSREIIDVTFRGFVKNSGNGLRRKDKVAGDLALARIAASRILKWLHYIVLPGQNIVTDTPHLVIRIPQVIAGAIDSLDSWDRTTADEASQLGIDESALAEFAFKKPAWTLHPLWDWLSLREKADFGSSKASKALEIPDYVFCEDISRFVPRSEAREFVANVSSPFALRYVVNPDSSYIPEDERPFLRSVTYRPEVRFAL